MPFRERKTDQGSFTPPFPPSNRRASGGVAPPPSAMHVDSVLGGNADQKRLTPPFLPDQWLNRGWRGPASNRVLIREFAYALLPRSIKRRAQGGSRSSLSVELGRSSVCLELVELVELGVEVERRVAEWSRDAEEGSGVRVRRSRCGPETPLAGRSVRHSPLLTPSINNSPHPR